MRLSRRRTCGSVPWLKSTVLWRARISAGLKPIISKSAAGLALFAGGDRSIRGYKYKGISPRDEDGKLTGASKLATGSLEYQYNVTGKWWSAVFIDSGEAVNDIKQSNVKTGAGVGVRWQSPIGPVKLDIARAIGDEDKRDIQFYIGLGPEL